VKLTPVQAYKSLKPGDTTYLDLLSEVPRA